MKKNFKCQLEKTDNMMVEYLEKNGDMLGLTLYNDNEIKGLIVIDREQSLNLAKFILECYK